MLRSLTFPRRAVLPWKKLFIQGYKDIVAAVKTVNEGLNGSHVRSFMNKDSKILIVGHDDIIENSPHGAFSKQRGYNQIFSTSRASSRNCTAVRGMLIEFFKKEQPEYVFLGSTRSGGIEANQKKGR